MIEIEYQCKFRKVQGGLTLTIRSGAFLCLSFWVSTQKLYLTVTLCEWTNGAKDMGRIVEPVRHFDHDSVVLTVNAIVSQSTQLLIRGLFRSNEESKSIGEHVRGQKIIFEI